MDGVTAIANILRLEGVEFIGCVPYQPLLEAAAIAGIRPIIFRQEGTGIHMVDGYSSCLLYTSPSPRDRG